MKKNICKPCFIFGLCVVLAIGCAWLASFVASDFGKVSIETGYFTPEQSLALSGLPVRITYKLYKPKEANESNRVPAVLAMHGYQNDKETSAAFCIELARRGIAVLSVDLYGHGGSSPGFRGRGWGNYKVNDAVRDRPFSGPDRYKVMMTFSVLDFFHRDISSGLADSSMGGKSAWQFLKKLPFVDAGRMGLTGHSMGTWAAWSVAAAFPEHRAIALQCGEVFPREIYDSESIPFNNVLLLQARFDEFENFRDYTPHILGLEKTPLRYRDFMGQNAPVEWNKTYGNFADGSARRMELVQNNHRLSTHDGSAVAAAMDWFTQALEVKTALNSSSQIFMLKEMLVLIAMISAMVSMLPLFLILTRKFAFFAPLALSLQENPKMLSAKKRLKALLIAILLSGLTFPFLTQLGHGLLPLPESIFRMSIGNGFITWLSFLMLAALCMLLYWYKKGAGKKDAWKFADLGLCGSAAPSVSARKIIVRSLIMTCILTGFMYLLVCISEWLFGLDFRFIWPFFRSFDPLRFGQFLLYLPFYAAFFLVNAGIRLYGQLRIPEMRRKGKNSSSLTQLAWWGWSVLIMLGGVFLIALIEYIPFFAGIGPGADLLFSPTFGGPFMSIMILLIPQFMLFFFFSAWFFRKSGTVYTGSFIVAILACWILCGGSAVF
ncbi:MAG: alpha/beta fold hydrolase [Treponema sp.]|nr:alpha/beta fold hydrolase [Treponema sp.]